MSFIITNDIVTTEDAKHVRKTLKGILLEDRIIGVETGACPHTAVREDPSMNIAAVEEMESKFPDADVVFHRIGRRQPHPYIQPRARRLFHLCDRRGRRRQDPAQGRPRHLAERHPCDKQDRPRPLCQRLARSDGSRLAPDAPGKPFVFTNSMKGDGIDRLVALIFKMALFDKM